MRLISARKIYSQENATKDLTGYSDWNFQIQEHDKGIY